MREIYIIPDPSMIEHSMQICEEYHAHFEYNDFFLPAVLDDLSKKMELIHFYRGLERDRSRDMLHGAFLDVTIHSEDSRIRQVSELRVRQSMDVAKELDIRGVVFHTNLIPNFRVKSYLQHWLDCSEIFWRKILSDYPNLEIVIENMFDETPDILVALAMRMQDEPRFGICFDYAHANAFGNDINDWACKLLPYTHHMHINDNDLKDDLHLCVGEGEIDWIRFDNFVKNRNTFCSVLIEVRDLSKQKKSLEYMKTKGIYPFEY